MFHTNLQRVRVSTDHCLMFSVIGVSMSEAHWQVCIVHAMCVNDQIFTV